jgi:beta-N-acetylhexosaminidase
MGLKKLNKSQQAWVERTLASMSLEEKIGHLICPDDQGYTLDEWLGIQRETHIGSAFFGFRPVERPLACVRALQAEALKNNTRIPLLIASDLENGAGCMVDGLTEFPRAMAAGAADMPSLVEEMGRITGREGRSVGIHWTFSPVVDLNINFQNPVTNVRSLGDEAAVVSRLAVSWIRGMQTKSRLAATAKHFPGDGMDDRDQHFCTTVNSASVKNWWKTYGKVWKSVIDAGVMSIMVGHISFPDYEGRGEKPSEALPATLSTKIQVDLLRRELDFQGVIVSDAVPMIGIASRVRREEKALENILAGSDVVLFAEPRQDFSYLMQAYQNGRLSLKRIEESVRRVLEMKARLNLHCLVEEPELSDAELKEHQLAAQALADRSITLLRANQNTPVNLRPGDRVLTITLTYDNGRPDIERWLPEIDTALRDRGLLVDHLDNPNSQVLFEKGAEYAMIFTNVVIYPHALFGTVRMTGSMMDFFWNGFYANFSNTVFTSFGSPYLLYEQPHLPNLYLAYGHSQASQRAAVKAWLGEMEATGRCPVKLPKY